MDPITSPSSPVPASPMAAPNLGGSAPEAGLSQEQMKANLADMKSKIDSKYQELDTLNKTNQVNDAQQQSDILNQLFDLLMSQGIDPNDPAAVGAFLEKMKTINPEVYQQVVTALNSILGPGAASGAAAPDMSAAPASPLGDMSAPTGGLPSDNMNIQNGTAPQTI